MPCRPGSTAVPACSDFGCWRPATASGSMSALATASRCRPVRFEMSTSPSRLGPNDGTQMIGIAALVIGIVLGLVFHPSVPEVIHPYLPIAGAAALDAVFGGLRGYLERIFVS